MTFPITCVGRSPRRLVPAGFALFDGLMMARYQAYLERAAL